MFGNKLFVLLLLLLSYLSTVAQPKSGKVYTDVEQMPYQAVCFEIEDSKIRQTCSNRRIASHIKSHLNYPDTAKLNKTEGTVIVSFTVNEEGNVINPKVLLDIGDGCGDAAIAAILSLSQFVPGQIDDEAVPVSLTVPIRFALKDQKQPLVKQSFNITWGQAYGKEITNKELRKLQNEPIIVRDAFGEVYKIEELSFHFKKRKRFRQQSVSGNMQSKAMIKLLRRSRRGGKFTIVTKIQNGYGRKEIRRSFEIR